VSECECVCVFVCARGGREEGGTCFIIKESKQSNEAHTSDADVYMSV